MKRMFAALLPSGCIRRDVAETAYQEAARRHRRLAKRRPPSSCLKADPPMKQLWSSCSIGARIDR
jgi:predicted metal-dependent hydrolase